MRYTVCKFSNRREIGNDEGKVIERKSPVSVLCLIGYLTAPLITSQRFKKLLYVYTSDCLSVITALNEVAFPFVEKFP